MRKLSEINAQLNAGTENGLSTFKKEQQPKPDIQSSIPEPSKELK